MDNHNEIHYAVASKKLQGAATTMEINVTVSEWEVWVKTKRHQLSTLVYHAI